MNLLKSFWKRLFPDPPSDEIYKFHILLNTLGEPIAATVGTELNVMWSGYTHSICSIDTRKREMKHTPVHETVMTGDVVRVPE